MWWILKDFDKLKVWQKIITALIVCFLGIGAGLNLPLAQVDTTRIPQRVPIYDKPFPTIPSPEPKRLPTTGAEIPQVPMVNLPGGLGGGEISTSGVRSIVDTCLSS